MMDVTSASMEFQLNIDFASVYQESHLHRYIILPHYFHLMINRELISALNKQDPYTDKKHVNKISPLHLRKQL